jgi:hypothetical protein
LRTERVRLSGDDDAVGGASVAGDGDRLLMGQEEGPAASGHPSVAGRRTPDGPSFAHASEAELARILDFYAVRWEYEPHTFPILWNLDGAVVESFSPDFYLPDFDTYIELTTLRQPLVRKKNRKLRRLRELYPDIGIKLFYARDFRALMLKYGKFGLVDALSGASGQVVPGDVVVAVVADELTLEEAGADVTPAGGFTAGPVAVVGSMPIHPPSGPDSGRAEGPGDVRAKAAATRARRRRRRRAADLSLGSRRDG